MHIYEKRLQYDVNTGKPGVSGWVKVGSRCDFTGILLEDSVDPEGLPYPTYILDYGDNDPMFGVGDEERRFEEEFEVATHVFLLEPYEVSYDSCLELVTEAAKKKVDFSSVLRDSRIRTARKLIESGEIKPENLNGFDDY